LQQFGRYGGRSSLAVTAFASVTAVAAVTPPTPIVTDNSTAAGIANDTTKRERSKAIDMRLYWIHDLVRHGEFIIWRKGARNRVSRI
jgi:hypothetical protein